MTVVSGIGMVALWRALGNANDEQLALLVPASSALT
jgi:hypothetical protein